MDVFWSSLAWQIGVATPCLYFESRKWRYQNAPIKYTLPMIAHGKLGAILINKLELDLNQLKKVAHNPEALTFLSVIYMVVPTIFQLILLPFWLSSSRFLKFLAYSIAIAFPVLQSLIVSVWITYYILIKTNIVRELKLIFFPDMEKVKDFNTSLSPYSKTSNYIKRTLKRLNPGPYYETLQSFAVTVSCISMVIEYLSINSCFPNMLALSRKIGEAQIINLPITKALVFYLQLSLLFTVFCIPAVVLTAYIFIRMSPYKQYKVIKSSYYPPIPTALVILLKMT